MIPIVVETGAVTNCCDTSTLNDNSKSGNFMTSSKKRKMTTKIANRFSTTAIVCALGFLNVGSATANTDDIYNPLEQQLNNLMLEQSEDEKAAILALGSEVNANPSFHCKLQDSWRPYNDQCYWCRAD
jgi:hypothetical protein